MCSGKLPQASQEWLSGDDKDTDADNRCDPSIYNCLDMRVTEVTFTNLYCFPYYVILNAQKKMKLLH